ncbi:MAG: type II secretion system protein, partial [Candidatus Doudnabacteria bacterium]
MQQKEKFQIGYTLIELLVSVAVFAILTSAFLSAYSALTRSVKLAREKTILSAMASERMEIVRNLPFSQVGTIHGVPAGSLPDESSPIVITLAPITYKIYYEVTWTDDPADLTALTGDSYPTDYKQVKMKVLNTATGQITAFTTSVSPKGLETPSNTGVLQVQVFNSTGQPLSNIDVAITGISNGISLNVKTNAAGEWV